MNSYYSQMLSFSAVNALMTISLQDQFGRNKVPEWQRLAGKAAKEVEKFAKEKADLMLVHWRDKMGIAQKEVSDL